MTSIVEDLLLLARSDSGAVALEHIPVDLGDVAADGASAMGKPATDRGRPGRGRPAAGGRGRRSGPAAPAGHDPGRQRDPPQPDRRPGRGRRAGDRERRLARRRGRRPGHPARGPAPRVRAVLPRARARRAAGPGSGSRSRPGSSIATAAGSRWPTGPRAGRASWSTCRRRVACPADGRSALADQVAIHPVGPHRPPVVGDRSAA